MSTNLRNEFEEYVKKLTVEISKEIFLQQLAELYSGYQNNLQQAVQTTANLGGAVQELSAGVQNAARAAARTEEQSRSSLQAVSEQIVRVENQTNELFSTMRRVNDEDRQALLSDLNNASRQYASEVRNIMDASCSNISQKLGSVITREQLQQFRAVLEENTRESLELAKYVSGALNGETEASIENMRAAIRKTLDAQLENIAEQLSGVDGMVGKTLEKQTKAFSSILLASEKRVAAELDGFRRKQAEELEASLKQQKELIRTIRPTEEQIGEMIRAAKSSAENAARLAENTQQMLSLAEKQQELASRSSRNFQDAADQIFELKKELEAFREQAASNDRTLMEKLTKISLMQKDWREIDRENRLAEQKALHAARLSQKLYVVFGALTSVALFTLLVAFQKPWAVFGVEMFCFITGGTALVYALVCILIGLAARKIAGKQYRELPPDEEE